MICPNCSAELSTSYGGAMVCGTCGYARYDGGGIELVLVLAAAAVLVWAVTLGLP